MLLHGHITLLTLKFCWFFSIFYFDEFFFLNSILPQYHLLLIPLKQGLLTFFALKVLTLSHFRPQCKIGDIWSRCFNFVPIKSPSLTPSVPSIKMRGIHVISPTQNLYQRKMEKKKRDLLATAASSHGCCRHVRRLAFLSLPEANCQYTMYLAPTSSVVSREERKSYGSNYPF